MTNHIGFEKIKLHRKFGNKPCDISIDGREFHFKSLLEYRWAQYLEFLKRCGEIENWDYESKECKFFYPGRSYGAVQYKCDFVAFHKDGHLEFYECKGFLEGSQITKFKRLQEDYPNTIIHLVVMRIPKKTKINRFAAALKYVDRIIVAPKVWKNVPIDMGDPGQTFQPEYRGRRKR